MRKAELNRHDQLKDLLVRLRDMTYERVRELRREQEQESEAGPADEMDLARATSDVETHAGLIARAEEKLKFIDDALSRVERGKYGECIGCRELIAVERLAALPFALYCIECQTKRNRARHGWSSGGTIPPYDHQWTLPEEMQEPQERTHISTESREAEDDSTFMNGEPLGPEAEEKAPRRRGRPRKRA
jgi:DnaK suppressor protein